MAITTTGSGLRTQLSRLTGKITLFTEQLVILPSDFNQENDGAMLFVACEQALRGGKRKKSLQLCRWNLNICIEKVDATC